MKADDFLDAPRSADAFLDEPKKALGGTGNRTINGVLRGLRDVPDAGAQLVTRGLEAVAPAGSRFEAWARGEREKVEGINKRAEEDYQQNWRQKDGIDWGRMGGNIIAGAALPGAAGAGAARTAATSAAVTAGMQPVYDTENFWTEKGKQAALGAAVPLAIQGGAAAIRGVTRPEVQTLMREGVTPTAGQILGGAANAAEQKMMSLPVVGDVIASGRRAALEDYNRAAINRSLAPLGQQATRIGRGGVDDASNALNQAYERVKPQMVVQQDQPFQQAIGRVQQMLGSVRGAGPQSDELARVVDRDILSRFTQAGRMGGEEIKRVQSDLRAAINTATARANGQNGSMFDRDLANALREVRDQFQQLVQRGNPTLAPELRAIDQGYANLARVQQAAASPGAREGVFTPAQLAQAVRQGDGSVRHNAYARGNAFMQDLTDAGRSVLDSTVPDSGTTGRAALAYLLGGGGSYALGGPAALAGAAAASLPYLPGGRQVTAAVLARRPEVARELADMLSRSAPTLAPASAPLLLGDR